MADKVVVVRLRAAVGEYTSGLARAGGQAVTFGGQLAGAAGRQDAAMSRARVGMANLATGAVVAGKLMLAGIGGAMVVSAKAAIDFESSLAGVAKTVEGTDAQIDAIGESMRRLSVRIPVNVNELNRIAELGGQLGVSIPGLLNFTKTIAALGVTTNLSTEDAAKGLARLINVTDEGEESFDNLGSVLVDLGNNFATTESEILTFALRIAPAAQTVGATAIEVLGLASALSSMGIPAERGGTAVQTMFTIIAAAAQTGGDELLLMAEITGLTVDEFQELTRENPTQALVELAAGLGRANEEGQNVFTMMRGLGINGRRAQAVLLAMSNNTDLVVDSLERATIAGEDNTALFEEAEKRYGTTASQIQIMGNAFTDLRIELGQALLEPLTQVVRTIAVLFDMAKDNSGTLKEIAVWIGRIGAAFVALGIAKLIINVVGLFKSFLLLAQGMGTATVAAGTLTALSGPIGLIALAIGAVVTILGVNFVKNTLDAASALATLRGEAETFKTSMESTGDPVEAIMDAIDPAAILDAGDGFEAAGIKVQTFFDAVKGGGPGLAALRAELVLAQGATADFLQGQPDEDDLFGQYDDAIINAERIAEALVLVDKAIAILGESTEQNVEDFVLAFAAAEGSTTLSLGAIEDAARTFLALNPFGSDTDFIRWLSGDMGMGGLNTTRIGLEGITQAAGDGVQAWDAWLRAANRGDEVGDFYEDTAKLAEEWADDLSESFGEVTEAITDNMPAWDEYEQVARVSLSGALDAQTLFLEDMRDWANAQPALMEIASGATIAWFDSLDPMNKGGIAREWEENTGLMESDVESLNAKFIELADIADAQLAARLPQILRDASTSVGPSIEALVAALELPPGDAEMLVGAYRDGLDSFFDALPASLGPKVRAAIEELLDPPLDPISSQGHAAGESFIDGINRALNSANFKPIVIKAITKPVVTTIEKQWGISSPSKIGQALGSSFVQGLAIGMLGSLNLDIFQSVVPAFTAVLTQQQAALQNLTLSQSRNIELLKQEATANRARGITGTSGQPFVVQIVIDGQVLAEALIDYEASLA